MLRREGAESKVMEIFYRALVKVVLLIGLECWVLSATMERMVEGTHTRFMKKNNGKTGAAEGRRDVVYTKGRSSTGYGGKVGGAAANI